MAWIKIIYFLPLILAFCYSKQSVGLNWHLWSILNCACREFSYGPSPRAGFSPRAMFLAEITTRSLTLATVSRCNVKQRFCLSVSPISCSDMHSTHRPPHAQKWSQKFLDLTLWSHAEFPDQQKCLHSNLLLLLFVRVCESKVCFSGFSQICKNITDRSGAVL